MGNIATKLQMGTVAIIVLALVGCASQDRVKIMEQRQNRIEQKLSQVQVDVNKLNKQNYAALAARMDQLQVQLDKVNGKVEEQNHIQSNTQKKVDELGRSISNQSVIVNNMAQDIRHIANKIGMKDIANKKLPESTFSNGEVAKTTAITTTPTTVYSLQQKLIPQQVSTKAFYKKAFQLFQERNYEGARKSFNEFLVRYPKSKLANNAQFWIGECFYQEKLYQDAIDAYQKVIDNYPNGTKIKDAMLKQGMAFYELGDKIAARILFKKVIDQFSDSNQALIAKRKLENIEKLEKNH